MSDTQVLEKQGLLHLNPRSEHADVEVTSVDTPSLPEVILDNEEVVGRSLWLEKCVTCSMFALNIVSTVAIVFLNKL